MRRVLGDVWWVAKYAPLLFLVITLAAASLVVCAPSMAWDAIRARRRA